MPKKTTPSKATPAAKAKPAATTSTAVRNSPIPKAATAPAKAAAVATGAPAGKAITHADIARRAFEISRSSAGGDETHNWLLAERELRGV